MSAFLPPELEAGNRQVVTDMHAGGEPVRILDGGLPELRRESPLAKRRLMMERFDHLRRRLMHEPRGHGDMYGAILSPPQSDAADAGVLFTHCSGYSTMCGHATIALGRYLYDRSRAAGVDKTAFRLEAPCGSIDLEVEPDSPALPRVGFDSVSCFAEAIDEVIEVAGIGEVRYDLGYGGAYYAILPASALDCDFRETPVDLLAERAGALVAELRDRRPLRHPDEPDLGFLYGAILTDGLDCADAAGARSHNLCWFGDGQLDRSPTGSGVCARLAVDHAKGRAKPGDSLEIAGLSGEPFLGRIKSACKSGVTITVSGRAYYTGRASFVVEEADPLGDGFRLPDRFDEIMRR